MMSNEHTSPSGVVSVAEDKAAFSSETVRYSLSGIVVYFLKLGTIGFGGPIALAGYMHRDLVERWHWISEEDYRDGLALSQLAPGPLAAQLAFYLGFVDYGVLGATLVGLAFVLPSFVMVVLLGWAYQAYGGLPWMQAVFYGVGASVIGIIAFSAYRLTAKTVGRNGLLWAIFLISGVTTAITESESILLFLSAGLLVCLAKTPLTLRKIKVKKVSISVLPLAAGAVAVTSSHHALLWSLFVFFLKAGAFVFGSGLAIVPFLYSGVVHEHAWLTVQQFLDAVAVAMVSPGPVVITTGFIGFLVAGFEGACIAALATFLPAYILTILPAPYFKRYGKQPAIAAFVEGVTTAAIGAIAGAVVVLGTRSITDVPTACLAVVTLLFLWRARGAPEPLIIIVSALLGLWLYPAT